MSDLSNIVSGMMLMVDKPMGWTSFDVVNKIRIAIRKTFQLKKLKVGHAGTLDPMASGLLIICTGKMTKSIDSYQAQEKMYEGSLRLGSTTPTYDQESEVDQTYPIEHIGADDLLLAAKNLSGQISQTPPIYSAIKKDGVPLYKHARAGNLAVEIPTRKVNIFDFDLTQVAMPDIEFRVRCSKGTYIRSLVHDFGKSLKSGAYLTRLSRTAIGDHHLSKAWELEELIEAINQLRP